MKLLLLTGCDAPNREAELKIEPAGSFRAFYAYYEQGWTGEQIFTVGDTPELAAAEYWLEWSAKYEESAT